MTKIPNISGLGSFVWPEKYKDLADAFEMFWVTMKCPLHGHEWKWTPSKDDYNNTVTNIERFRVRGKVIWFKGDVSIPCPVCSTETKFTGGIHESGAIIITEHGGAFDDDWWVDET